jgi:penicillin-insensitive murein DD-endopeptidase
MYQIIIFMLGATTGMAAVQPESICYGTTDKGRIENAWQLPTSGENFSVYSSMGTMAGRTYVHSKVYATVVDAYKILFKEEPNKVFVYGETGWKGGGRFRPHKTHQNGYLLISLSLCLIKTINPSPFLPTLSINSATRSNSILWGSMKNTPLTLKRWQRIFLL